MRRILSRPLHVSGRPISNLQQFFKKAHGRHIVFPVHGSTEWPRQGPPPHLTRETLSGRGRYTRRSLSFRRKPSGRRRYCRHLPAEKERMISGRTFAREMIALRQRETKRAGRILALQGQNPGQLELRTHSEFGANLSVTPGGFAFLCLRAIPRRSSPAGYHSLRLRPAKTKTAVSPSPASDAKPPGRKTHIHTPPPRPLAVPAASSPA